MREEIIGDCRLILGDCRDVLPTLGRVDAVVTDPPYGIGITKSNRLAVSRGMGGKSWDDETPDIQWIVDMGVPAVVWGGTTSHSHHIVALLFGTKIMLAVTLPILNSHGQILTWWRVDSFSGP